MTCEVFGAARDQKASTFNCASTLRTVERHTKVSGAFPWVLLISTGLLAAQLQPSSSFDELCTGNTGRSSKGSCSEALFTQQTLKGSEPNRSLNIAI